MWRNARTRVLSLQGDLVGYDPALKEHRTVCFDGRCGGARALPGRGEADSAAHPKVKAL